MTLSPAIQQIDLDTGRATCARSSEEHELFLALARIHPDDPRHTDIRAELVTRYQGLAVVMARRYSNRGEPLEDLVQTANLGLVKAINGFDISRGNTFTTYAVPMVLGELKRHFRDRGWAVNVPRREQNLKILVHRAIEELTQRDGAPPTVDDLADHLDIDKDDVAAGLRAEAAYSTLSLDAFAETEGEHPALAAASEEDGRLGLLVDRESVWPLLGELPEQERMILLLRFYGNQTQNQIARFLGISQVHVSRLQTKACGWIRKQLDAT